jgi:hypothetical protein
VAIMQNIAQKAVGSLPLPKFLKDFLLYRWVNCWSSL